MTINEIHYVIRDIVSSDRERALEQVAQCLEDDTDTMPFLGAEVEFYLAGKGDDEALFPIILSRCQMREVDISSVEKERGDRQYEINLKPTSNAVELARAIQTIKEIVMDTAQEEKMEALFSAKPYEDRPGNGLHIHVSLQDKDGNWLMQKNGEEESDTMRYAVGGLLATMKEAMRVFAPNSTSHKRYVYGLEAPTTISWGGNNRTTALRIPDSSKHPEQRHIEHRVAGMDANPFTVIAAILEGVRYGLVHHIEPRMPKVHGNASDAQYKMPPYNLEAL